MLHQYINSAMFHVKHRHARIIRAMSKPIKSFNIEGVQDLVSEAGLPSFRAMQILTWLYAKGADSYSEMSNLPKAMRDQLEEAYPLSSPEIVMINESRDGTRKYLIEFDDGATTEMVALPSDDRLTVCASSQSGCAMKCSFCATGQLGLTRNLLPGEIVDQISMIQKDLGRRVTNVVVMGQGEPFANFENVVAALRILNHPKLLNIGARHITVSTCGVIRGIESFSKIDEQFTLAVSLHAARQEVRDKLMPKLTGQRLDTLKHALSKYSNLTGRRFSFEYSLMKGLNDSDEDLQALIDYCAGLLCHVNLIPLNEIPGSRISPVAPKVMNHWAETLERNHVAVSIRKSRGSDIAAACGQLALQQSK